MNFLGLLAYCKDQNITLSLDGEQLKVTCEDELFTPEFSEYLKSHKQQLVSHLKAQSLTPSDNINYEEGVVTTLMQKRFWLAQELSALGSAYNIVKTFKLMNAIDAQMLEQAFKALLVANPALTMTFKQVDGQLIQFPSDNSFSIVVKMKIPVSSSVTSSLINHFYYPMTCRYVLH